MSEIVPYLLKPLILTEFIELSVAAWFMKSMKWTLSTALANFITNPLINLVVLLCVMQTGGVAWYVILIGEISVFVFEAFLYKLMTDDTTARCAAMSFMMNVLSYSAGLLMK